MAKAHQTVPVGRSGSLQEQPTLLEAVPSFSVSSRIIYLCDGH